MSQEVHDPRSNPNENITHAAKVLQKSKHRKMVFKAIYSGQKQIKTPEEIQEKTKLSKMRITQEAGILFNNSIITRKRDGKKFVYGKDKFYNQHRNRILSLSINKNKLSKIPTKSNPVSSVIQVKLPMPKQKLRDVFITIDDIVSFSNVKKVSNIKIVSPINESRFKKGIQNILKEKGNFKDWGGEKNDLLTTRLIVDGKKRRTAFAFKGKGEKGILTPAKMGKNGDQIQRLFESPVEVFLVQYWNKIGERVLEQMVGWAQLQSIKEEKKIYYGIIDGIDSMRIYKAYEKQFPTKTL